MPPDPSTPLDLVAEPLARVSTAGETREANRAFRDLARRSGVEPELAALFGAAARALLARVDGAPARADLELAAGPSPRPWFRVVLTPEPGGSLTALLADVTAEMTLRAGQEERDREVEMLREIGAALSCSIGLDAVTERVCEHLARHTKTANFFIALYDRRRDVVSFPRYFQGGAWQDRTSRPFSNGLTEYVIRTARPLLINRDVTATARRLGIEPQGSPASSWLGVPMIANGEVLGAIATQDDDRPERYDRRDVEILSVIAGQAAAAIKHALLLEEARRACDELTQTQARLLESERIRAITEAVGAMNHEINNPLAAIVGNVQLLRRRQRELPPEVTVKLEAILAAAQRIQEVTTKMSTLIQASSRAYPGSAPILDLGRSVAIGEASEFPRQPEGHA